MNAREQGCSRPSFATRIVAAWLGIFVGVLGAGSPAYAQKQDRMREHSNLSMVGVDKLDDPAHRDHFSMIQYMPDPIEGFNRGSLKVTKAALDWFMVPVAKGWRFITFQGLRHSVDNFSYNLSFLSRFFSLLLQGKPVKAGAEMGHFIVNSTVGLAGFFDPATSLGIPTYRQDVGLAFARWGAGPGFYFVIPVLGPSSGRDAFGRLFDMALTPVYLVPGLGFLLNANAFSSRIDGYEALKEAEPDLYFPLRALWSIQRTIKTEHFEIPPEAYAASDPEPSLGVLLFKVKDPKFPTRATEGSVEMPSTGQQLPYSLWMQDKPAPLVYLIPGIGAHRQANNPVALAELIFDRGNSVAIVSSPWHPEFLLNGLSAAYPGYTPSDAKDLYQAFSLIDEDLQDRYPRRVTARKLIGYSMGAIETLHIAAQDNGTRGPLRFDRFVAINPPPDLPYAARSFDRYFNAPLRWSRSERDQKVKETVMKAFLVAQKGLENGKGLPFDRAESEFLVGFTGRITLVNTVDAVRKKGGKVLTIATQDGDHRGPLLDVINQSSFRHYADELIIPYYLEKRGHGVSRDELAREASLFPLEAAFRTDDRIRILTNANDFLLSQEGLAWLRETLPPDRLTVFPEGGHLGNIYHPEVQRRILDALD